MLHNDQFQQHMLLKIDFFNVHQNVIDSQVENELLWRIFIIHGKDNFLMVSECNFWYQAILTYQVNIFM